MARRAGQNVIFTEKPTALPFRGRPFSSAKLCALSRFHRNLLVGNKPHRRLWPSLNLPGAAATATTPTNTLAATVTTLALAAAALALAALALATTNIAAAATSTFSSAVATRAHPRPPNHLFQHRRRHHNLRQRGD